MIKTLSRHLLGALIAMSVSASDCGLTGDGKTKMEKALNPFKNRSELPIKVNPAITLQAVLKPGRDLTRFKMSEAASVTGYVMDVKPGGLESCNCHSKANRDTHIALALTPTAPDTQWVIVEVTPRFRDKLGSTASLRSKFLHRKATVTGWMFYDGAHTGNAENSHPNGRKNWRATCWEIHPITKIQ